MSTPARSRTVRTLRRHPSVLGLIALGIVLAAGCSPSKSGGTSDTVGRQTTLDGTKGYTCSDPTGDVALGQSGKANRFEPSGIDLTEASAHIVGDNLVVSFSTAGPIASAPDPLFVVDQGDPAAAPETSFELRAELPPGAPGWTLNLHTFKGGREASAPIDVPVTVNGNTLGYTVPLSELPPVVSLQWQFGATSTAADSAVSFDACSSFADATTTTR